MNLKAEKIWFNGRLVSWDEAQVHVAAHALHYGSSVFEGIRCYDTPFGPALFCLDAHLKRLYDSCKIYRMSVPVPPAELRRAVIDTVRENHLGSCYARPIVFRGVGGFALDPRGKCPVDVAIITVQWDTYLGKDGLERGVDVGISTWARMAPNTYPALAKAGGHYTNSQLIVMEAVDRGFAEGIALDVHGHVSEGSGENLFIVRDGLISTPTLGASILGGITRSCVMRIARDLGYEVQEEYIPREVLYIADEAFFTGTAAEVTPVRSVDGLPVGEGKCGPMTRQIQEQFFGITSGKIPDRYSWLTPVDHE